MEISTYLKAEQQRNIAYYLLPGFIAFLPLGILLHGYLDSVISTRKIEEYVFVNSAIVVIVSLGVGILIEDIGARLEILFEYVVCLFNGIEDKHFMEIWYQYLVLKISKEREPVLVRYYRSILLRLKFEFNTGVALALMFLGFYLSRGTNSGGWCLFENNFCKFLLWSVIVYLFFEAYKGVKLLHQLREKLVEDYKLNRGEYLDIT